MTTPRALLKGFLGQVPGAVEAVTWLRARDGAAPAYPADRLRAALPGWAEAVRAARGGSTATPPRRLLVVGMLRWWVEYAVALGLLLAAEGHQVDLALSPYLRWHLPLSRYDARRLRYDLRRALRPLWRLVGWVDLLEGSGRLPPDLAAGLDHLSHIDVQYTQLREEVDLERPGPDRDLYLLRRARNRAAARAAWQALQRRRYDAVIIPNGSVLEFGAVYRVARRLGVRAVTYEFGEQKERLWLAQDDEVMRQDTSALWAARGGEPLTEAERGRVRALYRARRGGELWANFARRWQVVESRGARKAREALGLDTGRPVVLLCTNVVGDSLALGRQVFTQGMADWLARTVRLFAERPQAQLVVRVHPGEMRGVGHPAAEVVRGAVPSLPAHVKVVAPDSPINTYDLIELADFGLVYTTTVGMEMAMAGVPVVVAGQTHYRGRGFTHDPETWEAYVAAVDRLLAEAPGCRLGEDQVELAWRYAYRFFFEYPFPFPWHLVTFWVDMGERPLEQVVTPEGREPYAETLRALAGEPVAWMADDGGPGTGDGRLETCGMASDG